jgi:hypothetical protein
MALNLSGQTFEMAGSKTFVSNENVLFVYLSQPGVVSPPSASSVVGSLEQKLVDAAQQPVAVQSAQAVITASMPAAATLAGAAQVRVNPGSQNKVLVLDFQGLRTITELAAPPGTKITDVRAWLGTAFADKSVAGFPSSGGNAVAFQELQAERLLVTLDKAVSDPAAFAASASVVIPTPPSGLELLVNGTRAFFRPEPIDDPQFTATVDLTEAVTAAVASGGDVVVTFRASAPASLTLAASAQLLQRYPVVFPEAAARTVDAATEGVYPLLLPVQSAAITDPPWAVRRVLVDVSAKLPSTRVIPADGPQLSADAELVLDPDHAIVVRLPTSATASLGTLTGLRLPVSVDAAGAELAGTLRGAAPDGGPGDPIPKGALGPVTLEPTPDTVWIDLALTKTLPLEGGRAVWLEVQAARGSVVWKLAVPPALDADAAPLRRRTPNGRFVALSALTGLPYMGALRVVGQERPNDPLAAVLVSATGAGASGTVAGVPTQAGTAMALVLDPPVSLAAPAAGDADFSLDQTNSAPGSYAITSAELQYTTQ